MNAINFGYEQINQDNPVTKGSTALVLTSSQTEISDGTNREGIYKRRYVGNLCKRYGCS